MKTRILSVFAGLAGLLATAHAFTFESATELFLNADFDGDGREDVVIVDRATGAYRLGFQTAADSFTWADARPSGITNVTALTSGRMLSLSQDALAFGSVAANRVNLFAAASPSASSLPLAVYPKGLDLGALVSLNAGIAPVTTFDDLICATTNGVGVPYHASLYASSGVTFTFAVENTALGAWRNAQRIRLQTGGKDYVGAIVRAGANDGFRVFSFDSGAGTTVTGYDGLPSGARFVTAIFNGGAFSQFVFYAPGDTGWSLLTAVQLSPGVLGLSSLSKFSVDGAIDQLYPVYGAASPGLLAILAGGAEARVYGFNGVDKPELLQTLSAESGRAFTGATPLGAGGFHLLSGAPGAGRSDRFQRFAHNGKEFRPTAQGDLPAVNPLGINANVFLFAQEPFVAADPGLIQTLNAADWSSTPSLGGGVVKVNAERYADATNGLSGPAARTLGSVPAGANFALVNQYAPAISVASFQPALGSELCKVAISPTPGPQSKAIQLSLSASSASYVPVYSLNGGAWTQYSAPFWVFRTTTIRYFAQHMPDGTAKTPTRTAVYAFASDPALADSDGDSVPDYVELGKGLDPTKGPDSDGDGFTDLSELMAGADPNSSTNTPAASQRADEFASFDLWVAPRCLDAISNLEVSPHLQVEAHAHRLNGSLVQSALTRLTLGHDYSVYATFHDLLTETYPALLAVGTAANFDIYAHSADPHQGRELLGLVAVPLVRKPTVGYTFGGGSLTAEAANWIAAASSAYAAARHPTVEAAIGVDETLAALLFERKVNQLLVSRGVTGFNPTNLTLFGFRREDTARLAPTLGQLTGLSLQTDAAHPGYDLAGLHATLRQAVTNDAALAPLRTIAFDLYRISCLSNNASPGLYPLPVDALREFLTSGAYQSAYLAASSTSDADRSAAYTAAVNLLAGLQSRPVADFDLYVIASSFDSAIPRLRRALSGVDYSLFTASGVGYKFPDSFTLIEGAHLRVKAYTDFTDSSVSGPCLQVISASLMDAPAVDIADADHNALSDAWEAWFFGGAADPAGDADGDLFTNLREYLDGTDPGDKWTHGTAVPLTPPSLSIVWSPGHTQAKIGFTFPAVFADKYTLTLESTPSLGTPFTAVPLTPTVTGDQVELELPVPMVGMGFYRLRVDPK